MSSKAAMAWVGDLAPVFGASIDLIIEPGTELQGDYGPGFPSPDAFPIPSDGAVEGSWEQQLAALLEQRQWEVALLNLLPIPPRSLRGGIDGQPLADAAAFLSEALRRVGDRKRLIALVPMGILLDAKTGSLRRSIGASRRLEWVVYLGREAALLLGVHPAYRFALIALGDGRWADGGPAVVRLSNLSEVSRSDWRRELEAAARRGGGEGKTFIVLRDPQLDEHQWTYDRFSRQFSDMRRDASALGTLTPLSKWIDDVRIGLHHKLQASQFRALDESDRVPSGAIACFGGRSIRQGGELGSPVAGVDPQGVPPELQLASGDVLVRSILALRPGSPMVAAAVVAESDLPAIFDNTCIRLRWSRGVDRRVSEMIVAYLNSSHARDWLIAHGVQVTLNVATLMSVEIPEPSPEVLEALLQLGEAELQYRTWADAARKNRQDLFSAESFARELPGLLARHRLEQERLRAAHDVERLTYRVRNYYPHPIAFRYEALRQLDHGDARLDHALESAELTMQVLALMALIQLAEGHDPSRRIAGRQLASFCRAGTLHLDWGKCEAILEEAVSITRAARNPLSLPFPGLAELGGEIDDPDSAWQRTQRVLKDRRNRRAHLERPPDSEIPELSSSTDALLETLLDKASFLTTTPLVRVADYSLDPLSNARFASFDLLQGVSPAFTRTRNEIDAEIPRGAVGFLDHRGVFRSLAPWLMMEACPLCKRSELFLFSRFDGVTPTYVAMESGHSREKPELSGRWAQLVGTASSTRE